MTRIRVCIGTEPRTRIAAKVLEFSIRRHARDPDQVDCIPLEGGDWSDAAGPSGQITGFSLQRWSIPERFDHRGKAIYLDADQLCRVDLRELWDLGAGVDDTDPCVWCTYSNVRWRLRRVELPETSVMLVDCARARGQILTMAQTARHLGGSWWGARGRYADVMHLRYLRPPPAPISSWWNVMDGRRGGLGQFHDPRAKILHFTRIRTQPWFDPSHPARDLWEDELKGALDDGIVTAREISEAGKRFIAPNSRDRPDGLHPYWMKYG